MAFFLTQSFQVSKSGSDLTEGDRTNSNASEDYDSLSEQNEPVDFIAMIALALQHDTHIVYLDETTGVRAQEWQQEDDINSVTLGDGASSFIERHSMVKDLNLGNRIIKRNDMVALKRSLIDCSTDAGMRRNYDNLERELGVYCHAGLRGHENISNLLFAAWQSQLPVPVLGLELAEYGTVKDFLLLAHPGSLRGDLAKHLVLDIALGLEALHEIGIAHGDVKPANILVYQYADPVRRVIARLADFSDSILINEENDGFGRVGGTLSWLAPECYGLDPYCIRKTDVYSFGLCAISILAPGPSQSYVAGAGIGDCFLLRQTELDGASLTGNSETLKKVWQQIELWKTDQTEGITRAFKWIEHHALDGTESLAREISCYTLERDAKKRKEMSGLAEMLLARVGRSRPEIVDIPSETADTPTRDLSVDSKDTRLFDINHPKFDSRNQNEFFKRQILEALEKIAMPALLFEYDEPEIQATAQYLTKLSYDSVEEMLLSTLVGYNTSTIDQSAMRSLVAARWLTECYLNGFGTASGFSEAQKWLAISALSGGAVSLRHASYLCVIEDAFVPSVNPKLQLDSPIAKHIDSLMDIWLVSMATMGYPDLNSGDLARILRSRDSSIYSCIEGLQEQSQGRLPASLANAVAEGGLTPLELALGSGNGELAVELLAKYSQAGEADECIAMPKSALHYVAFVEDQKHVESLCDGIFGFAPKLLEHVARESHGFAQFGRFGLAEYSGLFEGTPLHWAAVTPNIFAFKKFLNLHIQNKIPILGIDGLLDHLALMHQSVMLEVLMRNISHFKGRQLSKEECDNLLYQSVKDSVGMEHLFIHRADYLERKKETVELLLKAGADPFLFDRQRDILNKVVIFDDVTTLKQFLDFIKLDLRQIFKDEKRFRMRSFLRQSIFCYSWHVFQYLTEQPAVVYGYLNYPNPEVTALHTAVMHNDIRFLDRLLDLECDPCVRTAYGELPLEFGLKLRSFGAAQHLIERATKKQLDLMLKEPDEDGSPILARIVHAALSKHRAYLDMRSIDFLVDVGTKAEAALYINSTKDGPFTTLLGFFAAFSIFSSRPDYAIFDRSLLGCILKMTPPDRINDHDRNGLTPLHHMAIWAKSDAIQTLFEHLGKDGTLRLINAKTVPAVDPHIDTNPGKTALDFAIFRRNVIPDAVQKAGQREIIKWQWRAERTLEILRSNGAEAPNFGNTIDELRSSRAINTSQSDVIGGWPVRYQL